MEVQQVVVLTERGDLQLTSLSRHVMYHATLSLLPQASMHTLLPRSGSRKIENFCMELPQAIIVKNVKKKTGTMFQNNQFVPSIEIHKFLERASSVEDFTLILEKQLLELSGGEVDLDKLHEVCWTFYEMERKSEISIPQWFSSTCTYRLWLVFCCVQEQALNEKLSAATANEVIKRLVELCGYTWNESYRYCETEELEFPQYLRAIASYFTRLRLNMSLTCEVILDMLDEIVHGVLKKGYLTKRGHKRKNLNKRWFILQRNIMKYFNTRENMSLKGQLILNSNTEVKSLPDKGKRRCSFEVTCGHTGTPFEIHAEDQRTKHEWMLAIKKAIALAKVLDGSMKQDDYSEYLTGFYLLKYGTPQPFLNRQDSTVRGMKYHATLKTQRKRLSGKKKTDDVSVDKLRADSLGEEHDPFSPQDEYMEMGPSDILSSDSSEEGGEYTNMCPISEVRGHSRSMEMLDRQDEIMEFGTLTKSCSVSQAGSTDVKMRKPTKFEPTAETPEDRLSCSDNYEEAVFTTRYSRKTSDSQLGGYIDVKKAGGQNRKSLHQVQNSLDEETEGVGLLTARTLALGILDGNKEDPKPPSSNEYLTIVRDDETDQEEPLSPTPFLHIPVRKSAAPESSTVDSPPAVPFRGTKEAVHPPTRAKQRVKRESSVPLDLPPPPPHRNSDPSVSGKPTQRSMTETSPYRNVILTTPLTTPPPLPPR